MSGLQEEVDIYKFLIVFFSENKLFVKEKLNSTWYDVLSHFLHTCLCIYRIVLSSRILRLRKWQEMFPLD